MSILGGAMLGWLRTSADNNFGLGGMIQDSSPFETSANEVGYRYYCHVTDNLDFRISITPSE